MPGPAQAQTATTNPIRHVIVIMQENRSFDQYFGTFPGADGIPPDTCVPRDPSKPSLGCIKPFHDQHDVNAAGPHSAANAQADLDDGITTDKMDGFVYQQATADMNCQPDDPNCSTSKDGVARHDVMGYHTETEIPNYWAYARHFVLQDRLFEGIRSWSWPSHLDLTSEWSARCSDPFKALSCKTDPEPDKPTPDTRLPWVSLFQLLDSRGVSWKYYLGYGTEPDCEDGDMTCPPKTQSKGVASIWNPPPYFGWVKAKGPKYLKDHNPDSDQFLADVKSGKLPEVSWIVPSDSYSEHPPHSITRGMEYVTAMVNAVMQSSYWSDTVIFLAWDDWGGFYDHVVPPNVDGNDTVNPIEGFGLRVSGIAISAYAKAGLIDHQVLSLDSYATFIEDLFMGGARLNPAALGNPDNRPDIRDAVTRVKFPDGSKAPIGNLMNEFDFKQAPLNPLVLSTHIPTGIRVRCGNHDDDHCSRKTVKISWESVKYQSLPGRYQYHVTRDGMELAHCVVYETHCTDEPGAGSHLYRAYSVDSQNVASPLSAAAEADVP